MSFDTVFASPGGRTSRGQFALALIPLLAVTAFYFFFVKGRNGEWVLATLMFPALMLHARRLHDMGLTAWLLIVPGGLMAASFWLVLFGHDAPLQGKVAIAALAVSAGFAFWGLLGKGQAQANRYGEPV